MQTCPSCREAVSPQNDYCPYCGKRLRDIRHTVDVHQNPHQQPTMPPGYLEGEGPPPHSTEQPRRMLFESRLKTDGKHYFPWLAKSFFGSDESIHPLLASIVPFLVTLFSTLAVAPYFNWRAGPFFIFWLVAIVTYGAMFFIGYLAERNILKGNKEIGRYFARFSSLQTMVLGSAILAFIVNLFSNSAYKIAHYYVDGGEFWLIFTRLIPILVLVTTLLSLSFEKRERRLSIYAALLVSLVFWLSLSLVIYVFTYNMGLPTGGGFFNFFG